MKQYSKQVQAEKQKERTRNKKEQIAEITKLRKQRASSGFQGELEFDQDMKAKQKMKPDVAGLRIRPGVCPFDA
jgi:rRNA-processing protein EBP2